MSLACTPVSLGLWFLVFLASGLSLPALAEEQEGEESGGLSRSGLDLSSQLSCKRRQDALSLEYTSISEYRRTARGQVWGVQSGAGARNLLVAQYSFFFIPLDPRAIGTIAGDGVGSKHSIRYIRYRSQVPVFALPHSSYPVCTTLKELLRTKAIKRDKERERTKYKTKICDFDSLLLVSGGCLSYQARANQKKILPILVPARRGQPVSLVGQLEHSLSVSADATLARLG